MDNWKKWHATTNYIVDISESGDIVKDTRLWNFATFTSEGKTLGEFLSYLYSQQPAVRVLEIEEFDVVDDESIPRIELDGWWEYEGEAIDPLVEARVSALVALRRYEELAARYTEEEVKEASSLATDFIYEWEADSSLVYDVADWLFKTRCA
tara:strand:+ start:269329 stop:269784 length:456 start_codon:yes stop_codon:yes gene_type:complete